MIRLFFAFALFVFGVNTFAQSVDLNKIIPPVLKKYKPGMSYEDYRRMSGNMDLPESIISFRQEVVLNPNKNDIKEVTLYFDKDTNQPLYEYIIEFNDAPARDAYVRANLGAPNYDGEWKWKQEDGLVVKAWTFMNKLVIAIVYPETEWVGED